MRQFYPQKSDSKGAAKKECKNLLRLSDKEITLKISDHIENSSEVPAQSSTNDYI